MKPWFKPVFTEDETDWVQSVFDTGFINDGELTREFERQVADLMGYRFGVAVTSGTAAIALALMAKDVGPEYDVLVPDLTFIATANAVRLTGANVLLCDVEPDTMCLSARTLKPLVHTLGADAIVAVEVNGRQPDYAALLDLCQREDMHLVIDACEAFGVHGSRLGTTACLSFSPNKLITTGQGGMVLTNDPEEEVKLRQLKDQGRPQRGTGGNDDHPVVGFNFKFTDLQAAVGTAQLSALERKRNNVIRRNEIYRSDTMLGDVISLPPMTELNLWFDILSTRRDAIAAALRSRGYDVREFWKPLHTQPPYSRLDEYSSHESLFPNATSLSREGLWLPSAFDLSPFDIRVISDCVRGVECLESI